MEALHTFERRRRRAQNAHGIAAHTIEKVTDRPRLARGAVFVTVCDHDSGERRERRIEHRLAVTGFPGVELLKLLCAGKLESIVIGIEALNDDFSGKIASA